MAHTDNASVHRITPTGIAPAGETLAPMIDALQSKRAWLAGVPVDRLLALFDDFGRKLLGDPSTARLEGAMFLSAWLRRGNLQPLLELNLGGKLACLDGFIPQGRGYLAAKPQGLAAMWMAGNVATLPMFSLVPALLAKNVCLVKLALPDPSGMDKLLAVLAESQAEGLSGADLLGAVAVVWFDYHDQRLNEQMSLAADAKIAWGGADALAAISRLPRREHCVEILFGPKYSIGVIGRKQLDNPAGWETAVAAFVRDIAIFDQRACSAPNDLCRRSPRQPLRAVAETFARHLAKLPPKSDLDAFTTMQIVNVRAMGVGRIEGRPRLARRSELDGLHRRRAVVERSGPVADRLSDGNRLVAGGAAPAESEGANRGPGPGRPRGVARLRRGRHRGRRGPLHAPGIMNNYESPWDGKLVVGQLVRWVTLKP